jgi:hypothetical protein
VASTGIRQARAPAGRGSSVLVRFKDASLHVRQRMINSVRNHLRMARLLVQTQRADGVERAAIFDDDGRAWIGHGHGRAPVPITLVAGFEPGEIGGPGWSAVGGRLPAAAVAAYARDGRGEWVPAAVADGAWVVFVDKDERARRPPVRFEDSTGALVSRSPSDSSRVLSEVEAERLTWLEGTMGGACPVCAARSWRAAPIAGAAGEHVYCAVCGHSDGGAFGIG